MSRVGTRDMTLREVLEQDRALLDAAAAIADMACRVRLNGAERVYASEKLGHALYPRPRRWRCAVSSLTTSPRRRAAVTSTDLRNTLGL